MFKFINTKVNQIPISVSGKISKKLKINVEKHNLPVKHSEEYCNFLQAKEKHIYILSDKYSIKPSKEIVLIHKDNKYVTQVKLENDEKKYGKRIKNQMKKTFLPRDYPNSVRLGYYNFTQYAFMSGTFFHIMNFISTQVLINALGFGISKSGVILISAGLNWVIKDGIGQIGSIFFSSYFATSFERNLKQWRVISLLMYNVAIWFEISTMLISNPMHFLILASAGQASIYYTLYNFYF
jgi:hypothetical protein